MPFTPSHAAAALPFLRTPLLPAALVIGTMAPDLPYFVPLGLPRTLTHSPLGVPTADLALTLVAFALWYLVLRTPILDLAPAGLRGRIPRLGPLDWRSRDRAGRPRGWPIVIMLLIASALVGIVTHVGWDAFTHRDSPLVQAWPALRVTIGPFRVSTWLQHLSSIGGLTVLVVWAVRWARRTPVIADRAALASNRVRIACWLAVAVAFFGVGLALWVLGMARGLDAFDGDLVFGAVTRAGGAAALTVAIVTAAWWAARARSRAQPEAAG